MRGIASSSTIKYLREQTRGEHTYTEYQSAYAAAEGDVTITLNILRLLSAYKFYQRREINQMERRMKTAEKTAVVAVLAVLCFWLLGVFL